MRRHRPTGGIQMFSFLDAMVCTMGALLVLLHAFARHGEVEALEKVQASGVGASAEELRAERESLDWRIGQLNVARSKTAAQLGDARLQLSHVEDHERRLFDRLEQLKIAARELERVEATKTQEYRRTSNDLTALQSKIDQAREALDRARRASQLGAASYSVVPYEGPNSTRRRPIYIECRDGSIVLQPEGIELRPDDFAGFLGPGNPLASALRAIREYWARQNPPSPGKPAEEPYPLLLVRPEGIAAYYAARSALDSWGSDFGYELVGSDWTLKFPAADPKLAEVTSAVINDARARMRELYLATRQSARNHSRTSLRPSSRGGFVVEHGLRGGGRGGGDEGGHGWDSLGSNWARGSGVGAASDENGGGGNGTEVASGAAGVASGGFGGSGSSGTGVGNDRSQAGNGSFAGGPRDGASREGNIAGQGAYDGSADSQQPNGQRAAGAAGANASRSAASTGKAGNGSPGEISGGSQQGAGARGGSGSQNGSGAQDAMDGQASSQGQNSGGSAASNGSPGSSGQQPSLSIKAGSPAMANSQVKKTTSMAKSRGRDWGLPDGGLSTAAATRPMLVECHNDRLVILPESSNEFPMEVRLGARAQDSMDEFVADVWKHMKTWGTAGKGLYWRPTLLMDIKPGAADRYAEVKALLADSGLEVHEHQPQAATRPPAKQSTRK